MKYRKIPVVIDAVKWEGDVSSTKKVLEFMGHKVDTATTAACSAFCDYHAKCVGEGLKIETLEGTMRASAGDYIIKGVSGEFYPCKPDIFEKTYEQV